MFKNIIKDNKELGLAERTQPSTAEIYTQPNIPTRSSMPEYTHTQTVPQIFNVHTSYEVPLKESRSKILPPLYEQDDANLCDYFASMQE